MRTAHNFVCSIPQVIWWLRSNVWHFANKKRFHRRIATNGIQNLSLHDTSRENKSEEREVIMIYIIYMIRKSLDYVYLIWKYKVPSMKVVQGKKNLGRKISDKHQESIHILSPLYQTYTPSARPVLVVRYFLSGDKTVTNVAYRSVASTWVTVCRYLLLSCYCPEYQIFQWPNNAKWLQAENGSRKFMEWQHINHNDGFLGFGLKIMMTSSNGNILRVTGHSRTKASDAELWCFLWSASE